MYSKWQAVTLQDQGGSKREGKEMQLSLGCLSTVSCKESLMGQMSLSLNLHEMFPVVRNPLPAVSRGPNQVGRPGRGLHPSLITGR